MCNRNRIHYECPQHIYVLLSRCQVQHSIYEKLLVSRGNKHSSFPLVIRHKIGQRDFADWQVDHCQGSFGSWFCERNSWQIWCKQWWLEPRLVCSNPKITINWPCYNRKLHETVKRSKRPWEDILSDPKRTESTVWHLDGPLVFTKNDEVYGRI